MSTRTFRIATLALALTASATAQAPSGWSPRLERRVWEGLTPAQVEAVARGADPSTVLLADGTSLAEAFARAAAETAAPLAFTPVDPCNLVRTVGTPGGAFGPGERRAFHARGNLGAQGGAASGCGVPAEAQALAVIVRAAASRGKGSLRVWPQGDPEPGIAALELGATPSTVVPVTLELCHTPSCTADFEIRAVGASTQLRIDVVGYFAPLVLTEGPKGEPGPPGPPGPQGTAGASCSVTLAGGNATLRCPDGTSATWQVGPPPPPPVVRSFTLETPDIVVAPQTETAFCYFFHTPNTETVALRRLASTLLPGVHDVLLFTIAEDVQPPGTLIESPCGFGTGAGAVTGHPALLYAANEPAAEVVMPSDDGNGQPVGLDLAAGTPAFLAIHVINATGSTIHVPVTLTAEALPAGLGHTRTNTYVTFNGNVDIPPQTNGHVESFTCDTPAGGKFWRLSMQTHKQGVHTRILDTSTTVFEGTDWEHPGAATFAGPAFYSFGIDRLTYECTYDNPTNRTIQAGDSPQTDEICVALAYFFPATESRFCFNNFLAR